MFVHIFHVAFSIDGQFSHDGEACGYDNLCLSISSLISQLWAFGPLVNKLPGFLLIKTFIWWRLRWPLMKLSVVDIAMHPE